MQENAKIKIRKLRQSFCFKARPLPDLNKEREDSKRGTKEVYITPFVYQTMYLRK